MSASPLTAPPPFLDQLFHDYNHPYTPGAAILVAHKNQILFSKCFGLANLEEKLPVTPHTSFRLASLTKQFTAMAILILAARRKLSLDDRFTDFFPDFPKYASTITIRHLLTHTSGLPDYENLIAPDTKSHLSDADVLNLLAQQSKTEFNPGSQFKYSNSGYALLAQLIEKISQLSFPAFLHENIFAPLSMSNTVAYKAGLNHLPNRAYGYSQIKNPFQRTDQNLTSAVLGDGGIYSSVDDLFKWDQALENHHLLPAEFSPFTPAKLNSGNQINYGFGWEINSYRTLPIVSHSGSTIGFRNFIARFPQQNFTFIMLTNRSSPLPADILDFLIDFYFPGTQPPASNMISNRLLGIIPLDPFSP
jgi:CubicO group peptidase (beta-lactamase class C family)